MPTKKIDFTCPHCGTHLQSPITEAGLEFPCPTCARTVVTPGQDFLAKLRTDEAKASQAVIERDKVARQRREEASLLAATMASAESLSPPLERPPQTSTDNRIPTYQPILAGASILRFFAMVAYVLGALALIAGIATLAESDRSNLGSTIEQAAQISRLRASATSLITTSICIILAAAVMNLLAVVSLAIRDMARNSFRE